MFQVQKLLCSHSRCHKPWRDKKAVWGEISWKMCSWPMAPHFCSGGADSQLVVRFTQEIQHRQEVQSCHRLMPRLHTRCLRCCLAGLGGSDPRIPAQEPGSRGPHSPSRQRTPTTLFPSQPGMAGWPGLWPSCHEGPQGPGVRGTSGCNNKNQKVVNSPETFTSNSLSRTTLRHWSTQTQQRQTTGRRLRMDGRGNKVKPP